MEIITVLVAYLVGSLPMGYLTVKVFTGKDITEMGSGRTGGTNAMRAGGVWIGILTGVLDFSKGYGAIWFAKTVLPDAIWIHVVAGFAAVFGHNWSIWMFRSHGRFAAGAGTGPNIGVAVALWPPIGLILVPIVVFFVMVVGYASLASLAVAFFIPLIFYLRHDNLGTPVEYAILGLLTATLVVLALRENIQRILRGTERRVGIFANLKRKQQIQ